MPDYSIKLYDDEIMSFRAEKHYGDIFSLTTCTQIATVFFTGFAGV